MYMYMYIILALLAVCMFIRYPVHRAVHWTHRSARCYSHGGAFWIWCCELSIYEHVIFCQVHNGCQSVFPCTCIVRVSIFKALFCCRPVSDSDIQILERRIMQTMDMIIMKKKRCVYSQATYSMIGHFFQLT